MPPSIHPFIAIFACITSPCHLRPFPQCQPQYDGCPGSRRGEHPSCCFQWQRGEERRWKDRNGNTAKNSFNKVIFQFHSLDNFAVLTYSKLCTINITSIFRFGRSVSIESPSGAKLIKNQNRLSQPKTPEQTETVSMTIDEQDNNDLITSLMMNNGNSCNTCNEPLRLKIVITVTRWLSSVWTAWQQTEPLSQVELIKDGPRRSSLDQSCLSINHSQYHISQFV